MPGSLMTPRTTTSLPTLVPVNLTFRVGAKGEVTDAGTVAVASEAAGSVVAEGVVAEGLGEGSTDGAGYPTVRVAGEEDVMPVRSVTLTRTRSPESLRPTSSSVRLVVTAPETLLQDEPSGLVCHWYVAVVPTPGTAVAEKVALDPGVTDTLDGPEKDVARTCTAPTEVSPLEELRGAPS